MARNTNSLPGCCLSGNGQVAVDDMQATVEENSSCHIKYHRTCTLLRDRMAECTRFVAIFQRGYMIYRSSASASSVASKTFGSRKGRNTVLCKSGYSMKNK